MRPCFVQTSNVKKFLAAVHKANDRGAPEAGMVLIEGHAGYGKTIVGQWWAAQPQNNALYIRLKEIGTSHGLLTEIVQQLGVYAPAHKSMALLGQAVGVLSKTQQPLVIDEVEHGLDNLQMLETVRTLSDLCELRVVMMGREYVRGRLSRQSQFKTRFSARTEFEAATLQEVRLICDQAAEVEIADDVVARIHEDSAGVTREIVKAIKIIERFGLRRKDKKPITLDDIAALTLVDDFTSTASNDQ